jgi:hypothetical protein
MLIYIAEILVVMNIKYCPLLSQTCFYATTCRRAQSICGGVALPIYNAQSSGDDDGGSICSDNGDLRRNIPVATISYIHVDQSDFMAYRGASFAWKV